MRVTVSQTYGDKVEILSPVVGIKAELQSRSKPPFSPIVELESYDYSSDGRKCGEPRESSDDPIGRGSGRHARTIWDTAAYRLAIGQTSPGANPTRRSLSRTTPWNSDEPSRQ